MAGDYPGRPDNRSYGLDVQRTAMRIRIFTLQNLDRWPEAELALRQAREFAQRTGSPDSGTWANAAVLRYWLGQWDDALAELGSYDTDAQAYLSEGWPALLVHGVAALIAGRREQRTTAGEHLRQGLALPIESRADRENQDFLVAAHALALEQSGETAQAMLRLAAILPRRDGEMTLTHQWLPDLVRLALSRRRPAHGRGLRHRPARPRPRPRSGRLGRPRPACGAKDCLSLTPVRFGRLWPTTGGSARQWSCPPPWRTWRSWRPSAATKWMPGTP